MGAALNRQRWREAVRDERGSASVWSLAIGLAIVLLCAQIVVAADGLIAAHVAGAAADLGALAGAQVARSGEVVACDRVRRVVQAQTAKLESCGLQAMDVTVVVSAGGSTGLVTARRRARAGPQRTG